MTSGVWDEMSMLGDPELKRLAKSLPSTILGSHADSTVAKYGYAFQHWKAWAEHCSGVAVLPVGEIHFALYLQHLSKSTGSVSAVHEAVYAISWVNQLAGHGLIAGSPLVSATLAGLKRALANQR